MRIVMLRTGAALPDPDRCHSSILITLASGRQSKVGTFSHTSPRDLGKLAVEAGVKQVVATHIGHVDSLSPVLKRAARKHLPVELMGPHQIDGFVSEIRSVYRGPLSIAHDLMRIDL